MMKDQGKRQEARGTKGKSVRVRAGFTLTEILIVIGIIVLLLSLAVPVFNAIRGTRSLEGAENQLSALMARVRTEAIGNQKVMGLFFFIDPRNPDRISCAEVEQVPGPALVNNVPTPQLEIYLDLVAERDFLLLSPGVGLQLVDDCDVLKQPAPSTSPGQRLDDGYLGYNTLCRGATNTSNYTTIARFGGVVLFDSNGRLTSQTYGFRIQLDDGKQQLNPTPMGDLLFYNNNPANPAINPNLPNNMEFIDSGTSGIFAEHYPRSQFGLVIFDNDAFHNANPGPNADPDMQLTQKLGGNKFVGTDEDKEEKWLDANALPLLVNRYNGTLTRGGS